MFSLTGIYLIKFVRKNILYQNFVSEKEFDRRANLYFFGKGVNLEEV